MTVAANLPQAAGLAFDNLQVKWLSNQLKTSLFRFWNSALFISPFPESDPNNHPVSNWLTLIATLSDRMAQTQVPIDQMTLAAEYVYRICWMTEALRAAGLITTGQSNAILGSYNAEIG